MFRILHLADLHVGWSPAFMPADRAAERQRRRDSILQRAVDFALDPSNRIGLVVIAGDLFESPWPDGGLVGAVLRELGRLMQAGVPVVTVPGNHDEISYPDSVYRKRAATWPGILVQNPLPERVTTLTVAGTPVHVYGLAYTGGITPTRPPIARFPRLDEPGFHLAVFHGSLGDWGGDRSLPLDPGALGAAGYHYVALGHVHRREELRLEATPVVYCGAVEGKGFDDPGVGRWTVVEVDGSAVSVTEEKVDVQPVETMDVDAGAFNEVGELRAHVGNRANPDRILRVRLTGALAFEIDVDELASSLSDRFFHVECRDETEALSPRVIDSLASEPTIAGLFVRRMQQRLKDAPVQERPKLQLALREGVLALRGGVVR